MCGIAGIYHFKELPEKFYNKDFLIRKLNVLNHRGPDDNRSWMNEQKNIIFFHNRLTIIDKSSDASQPMESLDKSVSIVFNGEIYNHAILRNELEQQGMKFKTDHSDTEVIINGFIKWGIDVLLEKLDGMYGFALYEKKTKKLYLARDKIGIKPLYYFKNQDLLSFSSEIKSIILDKT